MNCKWAAATQARVQQVQPFKDSVEMRLVAYFEYPKCMPKKKKIPGAPHCKKPDLDNIVKFYQDVLNGIAYIDDARISKLIAEKRYGDPRVEVQIDGSE